MTPDEAAEVLHNAAWDLQERARQLRVLAFRISEPAEGVRVEVNDNYWPGVLTVTFVSPTVDLSPARPS